MSVGAAEVSKEAHVRRLQREAETLLDAGLPFDAEQVASILCTIAKAAAGQLPPFGPGSYALSALLFSRALFAAGKVKRALHHATAASQYRRFAAAAVRAEEASKSESATPSCEREAHAQGALKREKRTKQSNPHD